VAAEAQRRELPAVSHLVPEISAPLLAAIPNGLILEWLPWSFALYGEPPRLSRGDYQLPDKPGFGLTLAPEYDAWETV